MIPLFILRVHPEPSMRSQKPPMASATQINFVVLAFILNEVPHLSFTNRLVVEPYPTTQYVAPVRMCMNGGGCAALKSRSAAVRTATRNV